MHAPDEELPVIKIIDSSVTALPFEEQVQAILTWTLSAAGRFVCVANTHMLLEAYENPSFGKILQAADLVTPDGMPLVWMMKFLGHQSQDRVAGMDLLLRLCKQASEQLIPVFFVGSQLSILDRIRSRLSLDFPKLEVAGMEPLPFRQLGPDEDEVLIKKINESGAKLVFVSLGCPKQEYWMASHTHKINAVMIGVGGVFPIYAGVREYSPKVIKEAGLEWLYRLMREPRRLWKRYASTIPIFLFLVIKQIYSESSTAVTSSYSEKIRQDLPEEWIADLESLRARLLKLNTPERKVKRKILFALLNMLLAKIYIDIENIWLSSKWNSKKPD
jgi:N-acetylglucosaminyldiphosphoundecaprenol N-acetyl-beta-D-mannosaminyltransferase